MTKFVEYKTLFFRNYWRGLWNRGGHGEGQVEGSPQAIQKYRHLKLKQYSQRLSTYYIRGRCSATSQFEKVIFFHNAEKKSQKESL